MMPKVAFLLLVGCAVAFGAAIEPKTDVTLAPETEEKIKDVLDEIFEELGGAVTDIFKEIADQIGENIDKEELQKDLDEIKEAIEEELKKNEGQQRVNKESKRARRFDSEEEIIHVTEEEVKKIGHGLKELFKQLFDQVSKQLANQVDKEQLEEFKNVLKHIFDHDE